MTRPYNITLYIWLHNIEVHVKFEVNILEC